MSEEYKNRAEEYNERARQREEAERKALSEQDASQEGRKTGPEDTFTPENDKTEKRERTAFSGKTDKKDLLRILLPIGGVLLAGILIAVGVTSSLKKAEATGEVIFESPDEDSVTEIPSSLEDLFSDDEETGESSITTGPEDTEEAPVTDPDKLSVEEVAEKCMPAMVSITSEKVSESQYYFGGTTESTSTVSGSGVIVERTTDALRIVTNYHVISDTEGLSVQFVDDSVAQAQLLGYDSTEDIALLSVSLENVPEETQQAITVIRMGDSEACAVGQEVVAIGNALGYGQSVSAGIISALNRNFTVDNVTHKLIQTDAAINPGNSGGALLNRKGELIGINEVKYSTTSVEGMGFAIPVSVVSPIIDNILERETREKVDEADRSYLGISCFSMPDSYVSSGYPAGVYVSEITPGFAAEAAGLQVGDIISAIENHSITSADDLIDELEYYKAGETVNLTVLRVNEDQTAFDSLSIDVTLSARADMPETESSSGETTEESQEENTQGIPEESDPREENDNIFTMPNEY